MQNSIPFPVGTPESVGIPSRSILQFLNTIRALHIDLHSLIIYRHGKIVFNAAWENYRLDRQHSLYSVSKAFTSVAIGIAADEGLLSIDDTICSFFPEFEVEPGSNLAEMRIVHLLNMNSGHGSCTFDRLIGEGHTDYLKAWFSFAVPNRPGSIYAYDAALTYLLGRVLHRITGQNILEFLRPRLFEPLGIHEPRWEVCPMGFPLCGMGLNVTPWELLKFSVMCLQFGRWEGRQLVSEQWIRAASLNDGTPQSIRDSTSYHYQFFLDPPDCFTAAGAFGQFGIVLPHADCVVVSTGGDELYWAIRQYAVNTLTEHFSSDPLPEDPVLYDTLCMQAAQLTQKQDSPSLCTGRVPYPEYGVSENLLGISRILFRDENGMLIMTLRDENGSHELKFSPESFRQQTERWLVRTPVYEEEYVGLSYRWISPDELLLSVRFLEMAYCLTLRCVFSGTQLVLSVRPNLSVGRVGAWLRMPVEGTVLNAAAEQLHS